MQGSNSGIFRTPQTYLNIDPTPILFFFVFFNIWNFYIEKRVVLSRIMVLNGQRITIVCITHHHHCEKIFIFKYWVRFELIFFFVRYNNIGDGIIEK